MEIRKKNKKRFNKLIFLAICGFFFQADILLSATIGFSVQIIPEVIYRHKENIIEGSSEKEHGNREEMRKIRLDYLGLEHSKNFDDLENKKVNTLIVKQEGFVDTGDMVILEDIQEVIDIKQISAEINYHVKLYFDEKNVMIKDNDVDYVVYFRVEELIYDDLTGVPYANAVYYRIVKNGKILYTNYIIPKKKKYLFRGEYTKLIKTKEIAKKIVNDLFDNYFSLQ